MARFADHILNSTVTGPSWIGDERIAKPFHDILKDNISKIPVVIADNVGDYFFGETDREFWDIKKDFPCLAPPFEKFWVEWRRPKNHISKTYGHVPTEILPDYVGVYFDTLQQKDMHGTQFGIGLPTHPNNAQWMLGAFAYVENDKRILGPICIWNIFVDENGNVVDGGVHVGSISSEGESLIPKNVVTGLSTLIFTALLTISFMHCKNVTLVTDDPPARLNKARMKEGKVPFLKTSRIVIDPMKTVLRRDGRSGEVGLRKAVHICRGHFADYREHGLFGKHKGVYWWNQYVRGDFTKGVIAQKYVVKSSKP